MNKSIILMFVFFLLAIPFASAVCQWVNVVDDYIAYYPFDYINGSSDYVIENGEGTDGIVEGLDDGVYKYGINGSIEFGNNDYLTTNLNQDDLVYPITYSMWFKSYDSPPWDGNHLPFSSLWGTDIHLSLITSSDEICIRFYENEGGSEIDLCSDGLNLNIDDWYYFTLVMESNNTGYLYINGELNNTGNGLYHSSESYEILISPVGGSWDGRLDEMAIIDKALNSTEISEIYNSGDGKRIDATSFYNSSEILYYNDMDFLTDISGNSNPHAYNGLEQSSPGFNDTVNNSAASFDGVNDFIDTKTFQDSDIHTISAWYKTTGTDVAILGAIYDASEEAGNFILELDSNGKLDLIVYYGSGTHYNVIDTSATNDGNWHHTVGISNGTDMALYVDNILVASNSDNQIMGNDSDDNMMIGRRGSNGVYINYFDGSIDEVRLYNRTLTTSEISSLYTYGNGYLLCGDEDFTITAIDSYNSSYISDFTINMTNGTTNFYNTSDGTTIEYNITGLWNITINKTGYDTKSYSNWNVTSNLNAELNYTNARSIIKAFDKSNSSIDNFSITVDQSNWNASTTNGSLVIEMTRGINNNITINSEGYAEETINLMGSDDNDYNFSLWTKNSFDISFYDSESHNLINDTNITIQFMSGGTSQTNTTNNGTLYVDLLIPDEYTLIYNADGYRQNTYITTLTNNSHQDISLYLINESESSLVLIEVQDKFGNYLEGVDITIQRYSEDVWATEQILRTDFQGRTEGAFVLSTVYYNFLLEYEDSIVFGIINSDENKKVIYAEDVSQGILFTIDILEDSVLLDYQDTYGVDFSLTYINQSNTTGYFRFFYDDPNNNQWESCLLVTKGNNNEEVCSCESNTVTSESAIITCSINQSEGTATYYAKGIFVNAGVVSSLFKNLGVSTLIDWGITGFVVAFFIVLVSFFMFLNVPALAILFGTGTFVVLSLMGIIFKQIEIGVLIILLVVSFFVARITSEGGFNA